MLLLLLPLLLLPELKLLQVLLMPLPAAPFHSNGCRGRRPLQWFHLFPEQDGGSLAKF
jgi:hypothetical protein